jgi:hypothetical protein
MPVDNPKAIGGYPEFWHRAFLEAAEAIPPRWVRMDFPIKVYKDTDTGLRKVRAFAKALVKYPLHPTSQKLEGCEFSYRRYFHAADRAWFVEVKLKEEMDGKVWKFLSDISDGGG